MIPRPKLERILVISAIAAAFAHNLSLSWLKWGDLMVDAGKEFDQPAAVLSGKLLYRDLMCYYGPFATYFNALLCKIFGVHMNTLRAAGLISALLMCVVLYRLARLFIARAPAALNAIAFLYLGAFGHFTGNANYNFVVPYTYNATYGILFVATSVYFLIRFVQKQKQSDFMLAAAALALSALCKVEILFIAAAVHAIFLLARVLAKEPVAKLLAIYALLLLPVALIYGFFYSQAREQFATYSANLATPEHKQLVLNWMGLGDLGSSLKALGVSFGFLLAALGLSALLAWGASRAGAAVAFSAASLLAAFSIYYWKLWLPIAPLAVYLRLTPFVLAALVVLCVWHAWKQPAHRPAALPLLLLFAAGLACLPRLLFQTWAVHFGFYLLPLGVTGLTVAAFSIWPKVFKHAAAQRVLQCGAAGILCAVVLLHYQKSAQVYAEHRIEVVGPRGTTLPFGNFGPAYAETVRQLATLPEKSKVLMIPEALMLSYLAGHDNPYRDFEYLKGYDEERALAEWQRDPPDAVVFVAYERQERVPRFGKDYALKPAQWIEANYEAVLTAPDGFVVIAKRRAPK